MTDAPTPGEVVTALAEHPHLAALVSLVQKAALAAAAERRAGFASRHGDAAGRSIPPLPDGLANADAATPYGNPLEILQRGVTTPSEAVLLGALLAYSAREEPESEEQERAFVAHVTWLAAHTPCDALRALDATVGDRETVWEGLARVALAPTEAASDFGRTEALVAAAALAESTAPGAVAPRADAVAHAADPAVRALLAAGGAAAEPLEGELGPPPLGPLATAVLAVTLLLFVWQLGRLVARVAFAYRRPATLRLTERGLEVTEHSELLGKVLRRRSTLVPLTNLARVSREVAYARAGLYAGLAALTLGTYFGTGLFVDGLRVPGGSAPLLGAAVVLIVSGLALDFVLSSALDSARGRCRVLVLPQRGRVFAIGGVDARQADAMLASVTSIASGTSGDSLLPAAARE